MTEEKESRGISKRVIAIGSFVLAILLIQMIILLIKWSRENNNGTTRLEEVKTGQNDEGELREVPNNDRIYRKEESINDTNRRNLLVVDAVTNKPIEDAIICLPRMGGQLVRLGKSDSRGNIQVHCSKDADFSSVVFQLPKKYGGLTITEASHFCKDGLDVFKIKVYSRLKILASTNDAIDLFRYDNKIAVLPYPKVAEVTGLRSEEMERELRVSRPIPMKYYENLKRLRLIPFDWYKEAKFSKMGECSVDICGDGSAAVIAIFKKAGCAIEEVRLVRGEEAVVNLAIRGKRQLAIKVTDEDKGIEGVDVTVVEEGTYPYGEIIQSSEINDPGSAIIVGERPKKDGITCIRMRTQRTDGDGMVRLSVLAGDLRVSAWSISRKWSTGYESTMVRREESSLDTIRMQLCKDVESIMSVEVQGKPARKVKLFISEADGASLDRGFPIQYPVVMTDENGRVDLSILDSGKSYEALVRHNGRLRKAIFPCVNGCVISIR